MVNIMLTLYVDTPFLRVQTKGLKSTLLTESLRLVDELVSAVVTCSRISFRVFVLGETKREILTPVATADTEGCLALTLHDTAKGV
jgi:hypothetical protein